MTVPCDVGGLEACPYWRTHESSPGEPVAYSEARAFQLYAMIEAGGWAMLEALHTITLTRYEADVLYLQLMAIQESVKALREQQQHGN